MTTNTPDEVSGVPLPPVEPSPVAADPVAPNSGAAYGAQPAQYPAAPYGAQPGQYPAAPYGSAGPVQPKGMSITSMVLGIVSLVLVWFGVGLLSGIAGVVFGHIGQKKEPTAKAFWLTGLITSYVSLALGLLFVGLAVLLFGGIFFAILSDPSFTSETLSS